MSLGGPLPRLPVHRSLRHRASETLAAIDAAVDAELVRLSGTDWAALAEAAPGQLPAHLVVSHFPFDSWVHEHDLMVP